jgi:hypothetical protein
MFPAMSAILDRLTLKKGFNRLAIWESEDNNTIVSTVEVPDGTKKYETAISSPHYYEGAWVVVQAYGTEQLALKGHARWTTIMQREYSLLPEKLVECCNSDIAKLSRKVGCPTEFAKTRA